MHAKPIASLIVGLALFAAGTAQAQAPSNAAAEADAQRSLQNGQPQAACDRLQLEPRWTARNPKVASRFEFEFS